MTYAKVFAGAFLLSTAAIAHAQTEVAPPATSPVTGANDAVRADVVGRDASMATRNDAVSGQYAADVAAYRRALRAHNRAVVQSDRREIAYADAMHAWRIQADDCKRGISAACNAPTPDPADFY